MKALLNRDGSPDTSFGIRPVDPELGRTPGVTVRVPEEDDIMTKAPRSGIYTLNGMRYVINAGDPLPDGAVMDEERAQGPAPENRRLDDAPKNRDQGGEAGDQPEPQKDPLGELTNEEYDALTPAEKGARTRAANKTAASEGDPGTDESGEAD